MHTPALKTAVAAALLACCLAPRGLPAQAALDTAFMRHVAEMARQRATALMPAPTQPENQRVVQQYRSALTDLNAGKWSDAATALLAVLQRAPTNPLYRGDLAYAYLMRGQYDPAATEYTRAYQAQQQNGWFVIGLGLVKASQRQFGDAAGAAELAASTDSSVVDSAMASVATGWFEAAGDRARALHWAHLAVQKSPGDATAWLRIASYLSQANDTTPEGMAAIRRYRALRPDDKLGQAMYAKYLYDAGQQDSAIAIAQAVAADSSFRPFAASVLLQAAGVQLRRDAQRTIQLVTIGQPWADSSQRATYSNILGRAQLRLLGPLQNHFEAYPSCDTARVLDTLSAAADRNLRAGQSFDSVRTRMMIDTILPPYRANAASALRSCRTPAQLAQPQRRPAARPAPARPRP